MADMHCVPRILFLTVNLYFKVIFTWYITLHYEILGWFPCCFCNYFLKGSKTFASDNVQWRSRNTPVISHIKTFTTENGVFANAVEDWRNESYGHCHRIECQCQTQWDTIQFMLMLVDAMIPHPFCLMARRQWLYTVMCWLINLPT